MKCAVLISGNAARLARIAAPTDPRSAATTERFVAAACVVQAAVAGMHSVVHRPVRTAVQVFFAAVYSRAVKAWAARTAPMASMAVLRLVVPTPGCAAEMPGVWEFAGHPGIFAAVLRAPVNLIRFAAHSPQASTGAANPETGAAPALVVHSIGPAARIRVAFHPDLDERL
jgi:hypothetical protein